MKTIFFFVLDNVHLKMNEIEMRYNKLQNARLNLPGNALDIISFLSKQQQKPDKILHVY